MLSIPVLYLYRKFAGFGQLVHFLGGKPQLGNGNGLVLGEAEMMHLVIANANAVCDLVPIIVCIEAIAALRLLGIVQLAVTAGQVEAVLIMGYPAAAHLINRLVVHLHGDIHIGAKAVCTVFDLCADLLPLPAIPIGDMGNFGLPFLGLQLLICWTSSHVPYTLFVTFHLLSLGSSLYIDLSIHQLLLCF